MIGSRSFRKVLRFFHGDNENNNDLLIKLIKIAKIIKLFVITFLVTEGLSQKKKLFAKNQNGKMFCNYIDGVVDPKKKGGEKGNYKQN